MPLPPRCLKNSLTGRSNKMKSLPKKLLAVVLALCFLVPLFPNLRAWAGSADALRAEVRDRMIARETQITLTFQASAKEKKKYKNDFNAFYSAFFTALTDGAVKNDGTLKGGDYLDRHIDGIGSTIVYDPDWRCEITLYVDYYTTAVQEAALDRALDKLLAKAEKSKGLSKLSDYKKVQWAYNYICSHVSYDYTHLDDDSYLLKYSAYAALVKHTAVCQGYSNLFYLMLQRLGIDSRIITGISDGEEHAWNIVRLGDKYYLCDPTWDTVNENHVYFLRGSKTFANHTAENKFKTKAFTSAYPISKKDYDPNAVLDAPETVKLASKKAKTATVTWSKVTDANSYTVYKSTDKKKWTKVKSGVTQLSYTLKSLPAGKRIYVKIVPVSPSGKEGTASAVKSVVVKK